MPIGVESFPLRIGPVDDALMLCRPHHLKKADANKCLDLSEITTPEQRNHLQHGLLGMATYHCHRFKMKLYGVTKVDLFADSFADLSSAAATVLSHDFDAAVATAVSTVSDSIGGNFGSYFRDSKIEIAMSGIELARTRIFKQITDNKQKPLAAYPVTRAYNDALRYHNVCNLPEGLSASSGAVKAATTAVNRPPNPSANTNTPPATPTSTQSTEPPQTAPATEQPPAK